MTADTPLDDYAGHTPGPWFMLNASRGRTLQVSNSKMHTNENAVVHWVGFDGSEKPRKERIANARLIADAPKLLQRARDLERENAELRAALAERQAAIDEWIAADIQNAVEMERTPVDIELLTAANHRLEYALFALDALATKEPQTRREK